MCGFILADSGSGFLWDGKVRKVHCRVEGVNPEISNISKVPCVPYGPLASAIFEFAPSARDLAGMCSPHLQLCKNIADCPGRYRNALAMNMFQRTIPAFNSSIASNCTGWEPSASQSHVQRDLFGRPAGRCFSLN